MLKVDVSEQDQAVELKGIISDQTGLDYAGFTYKHQDSGKTKSFYVYQRNTTKLSEGTEEFSLLVELPKGTNPGIWKLYSCLLYTSPSPRDMRRSRMPSSA